MSVSAHEAVASLARQIHLDPENLLALKGALPLARPAMNAHIHLPPNFSAFDSVDEAIARAVTENIRVLGVSNYYDFDVYGAFIAQARAANIFPLFGLEIICRIADLAEQGARINDPGNPGKFYFCGKGITCFIDQSPRAQELMALIRSNDGLRMAAMTDKVNAVFAERGMDLGLTAEAVIDRVVRRHGCDRATVHLQERHIAQAFQEVLFEHYHDDAAGLALALDQTLGGPVAEAVAVQNAIRSALMKAGKPAFVEETFVTFEQSRELILELGGVPCYPTLADGANPICEYETPVEALVERLLEAGIYAAEFIPTRNCPETLTEYVQAMRAGGIIVTAGTEHNTLDPTPLTPACLGGVPIPDAIQAIFWEGARVLVAHQALALQGQTGYVNRQGERHPDFADNEGRIAAFVAIGEATLRRYFGPDGTQP